MKSILSLQAAFGMALFLPSLMIQGQTSYAYSKIGVPSQYTTQALEITDDERVGGWATDFIHLNGFIESNGTYSTVTISGYGSTQVTAIAGNTIYGIVNQNLGFMKDGKGNVTILRPPSFGALPYGANAKGVVVGQATVFQGNQPGFILQNGVYKTFLVPGSNVTTFSAVNNAGVIVGTWKKNGGPVQSFSLANSQLSTILFPGSYSTSVTGINDSGEMIGWYYKTSNGPLGLFRYDGTSYFDVPTPPTSYACSSAHLNNGGSFVGSCADAVTKQTFSFIAKPAGTEIQLPPQ